MKVFILAAGLGTRLGDLTRSNPKALVRVGDETMLEHKLTTLKDFGFKDFVINVHHFAEKIEGYLAGYGFFGSHIALSEELERPLETGGAVKKAAGLLGNEQFMVHNVDIFTNLDYSRFAMDAARNALEENYVATLLVSDRRTERYLIFDENMKLVGWTNVSTGETKTPYGELDLSKCHLLAFSGVQCVSPAVFSLMESWPEKFSIIDFYLSVCKEHTIKAAVYPGVKIFDLGTPEKIDKYLKQ
ncbi:MAG: NTP transferase domain-containing protein, partial [Bacteroidales bacterium]|nr:NTP transferase domain-containing protein [Bacteroidales bacterium]